MWNFPETSKEKESGASVDSWHETDTEDSEVEKFCVFLPGEIDVALGHVSCSITLILVSDIQSQWLKSSKEDAQESQKLEDAIHDSIWDGMSEVEYLSLVILVPFKITLAFGVSHF